MVRVCLRPQMLALAPLFLYSNWFYAYQFACFNAALFSARTQALLPLPDQQARHTSLRTWDLRASLSLRLSGPHRPHHQLSCAPPRLVRAQGLNSAFYWAAQMAGAMLVGTFLDSQRIPVRRV